MMRIGFRELPMLGKLVGQGTIRPLPGHLDGIKNYANRRRIASYVRSTAC